MPKPSTALKDVKFDFKHLSAKDRAFPGLVEENHIRMIEEHIEKWQKFMREGNYTAALDVKRTLDRDLLGRTNETYRHVYEKLLRRVMEIEKIHFTLKTFNETMSSIKNSIEYLENKKKGIEKKVKEHKLPKKAWENMKTLIKDLRAGKVIWPHKWGKFIFEKGETVKDVQKRIDVQLAALENLEKQFEDFKRQLR